MLHPDGPSRRSRSPSLRARRHLPAGDAARRPGRPRRDRPGRPHAQLRGDHAHRRGRRPCSLLHPGHRAAGRPRCRRRPQRPRRRSRPAHPTPRRSRARAEAPHPIPIIETLAPRTGRLEDGAVVSSIDTPWVRDPSHLPEAACLAADLCVGAPVFAGMGRPWLAHPNPDMSLRFTGTSAEVSPIAGVGRLESITAGVATVRTEVWADGALLAAGASTSLLLAD